jgi:hypothetical protein
MWDDKQDRPHLVDLPTDGRTRVETGGGRRDRLVELDGDTAERAETGLVALGTCGLGSGQD